MKRLQKVICRALTVSDSSLSYERTLLAIEKMVSMIATTSKEVDWENEEEGFSLVSLIVGAYWYCSDYHSGQWSSEYRCLCALGSIYNTKSALDEEGEEFLVYEALEKKGGQV